MRGSTDLSSAPRDVLPQRDQGLLGMLRAARQLAVEEIQDREEGLGAFPELNVALCRAIINVIDTYLLLKGGHDSSEVRGGFDDCIELYQALRTEAFKLAEGSEAADPLHAWLLHALVAALDGWLADCFEHPTVPVALGNGVIVDVDELIAPLVRFLKAQPGISTYVSCQGGESPTAKAACVELTKARAELEGWADRESIQAVVATLGEAQRQLEAKPEPTPEVGVTCEDRTAVQWLEDALRCHTDRVGRAALTAGSFPAPRSWVGCRKTRELRRADGL